MHHLSRDELRELACRIEHRILSLSDGTAEGKAENSPACSRPATGVDDTRSVHCGIAPEVNPTTRSTLSEKVQELIHANDPWEGSGVGPTRWSLPFYGGHIIRTPQNSGSFPRTQGVPDLLPVFGGPPCTDTCGKSFKPPPADVSATSVSS